MHPSMWKCILMAFCFQIASHLQAVCQLLEWLSHTFARNIGSFERLCHPFVRSINPLEWLGHLFIRNINPFKRLDHPFVEDITPFERLGQPFLEDNRPYYSIPSKDQEVLLFSQMTWIRRVTLSFNINLIEVGHS